MEKEHRILILEDVPSDAELAIHELRAVGLAFVSKLVDTREAFEASLKEFSPDLVLSDFKLPQFDGLSALEIVRSADRNLPFILVTGALGDETVAEVMKRGATDFVSKNRLEKLGPAVQRALQEVKSREELTASEVRNKELDILKNKFIHIVSHQFRTPLNGIRWSLESLLSGDAGVLTGEQNGLIRIAHDAEVDVIRRINDLLTAMDIEEHRINLVKDKVSIDSLVGSVVPIWQKRCQIKQLECVYVPPQEPMPVIEADAEKLRLTIENLVENAVAYTHEKGRIEVKLAKGEKSIRFSVSDNGIGIPSAEQPRVFTRFFRATNASAMETDLSGLGLFIAKHFIEQHGGTIGFISEEGKGSTFWFELPVLN